MLNRWLFPLVRIAEANPYLWWLAWIAANRCTFLLPHDKSYFGVRHFGTTDGLLLDVGANTGISALSFHRLLPQFRILSLEPNPIHQAALDRVKQSLGPLFDYKLVGAGSAFGEIELATPVFRWMALHTFTSSDVERVRSGVGRVFGERVGGRCRYLHHKAPLVTIDSLGVEPSIVKIDAEGFDLEVLLGARETLKKSRPCVLVEIVGDARGFRDFFHTLNYRLFHYHSVEDTFEAVDLRRSGESTGDRNYWAIAQERVNQLPLTRADTASRCVPAP